MESKDELKQIDIKNRPFHYFDDIVRVVAIDFGNILLDQKSCKTYESILIYDISYKTFMGAQPLRITFDEMDRLIKIYGGIKCLVLFGSGLFDAVYTRIRYLISEKK